MWRFPQSSTLLRCSFARGALPPGWVIHASACSSPRTPSCCLHLRDNLADLESLRASSGRPVCLPGHVPLPAVLLPVRGNPQHGRPGIQWPRGLRKYANNTRQLSLAYFVNTRRWFGSWARSHLHQSLWRYISIPRVTYVNETLPNDSKKIFIF